MSREIEQGRAEKSAEKSAEESADERRWAAAALSNPAALAQLATHAGGADIARRQRLAPALARVAQRAGIETTATLAWRQELRASAATRLWLGDAANQLFSTLAEAGVGFLPLKGWDLGRRVYAAAEERPTSDIDVLLAPDQLELACDALLERGFKALQEGEEIQAYLREEGYAAALKAPGGQLVELHFRFWGSAPAGLAEAVLAASATDAKLAGTARAATFEHAYLIAAFHLFLDAPPRPAGAFRDLDLLAGKGLDKAFLLAECRRFGLELPLALASSVAAELFGNAVCGQIAEELRAGLRLPERWLPWQADVSSQRLVVCRLLAGRPSRHGWRLVGRRLWPHAGIVAAATPAEGSWLRRRLWYQWKHLRGKSGPGDRR